MIDGADNLCNVQCELANVLMLPIGGHGGMSALKLPLDGQGPLHRHGFCSCWLARVGHWFFTCLLVARVRFT